MYISRGGLLGYVLTMAVILSPVTAAQAEQCSASVVDGRTFEEEYLIGQERLLSPAKAEKWTVIAADNFVVPTNGYVLQEDVVVHDVKLLKGTILDHWQEAGSTQVCGYSELPKSKMICFTDADGDGDYESFVDDKKPQALADPLKLARASEVFSHAMQVEDIPLGLPALIRSVEVKKVKKKKYLELVLGTGNGFREAEKPMSLGLGTYEEKIKIKANDVSAEPVILGGIKVYVSMDEAGEFWVRAEGDFVSPKLSRDCTNTQLEFGVTKLQTHQHGFRGKSGITTKYINLRKHDITYEAEF